MVERLRRRYMLSVVTAELHTANVACFQRKVQLSGFSAYPDCSLSQLFRTSGVLLYVRILLFKHESLWIIWIENRLLDYRHHLPAFFCWLIYQGYLEIICNWKPARLILVEFSLCEHIWNYEERRNQWECAVCVISFTEQRRTKRKKINKKQKMKIWSLYGTATFLYTGCTVTFVSRGVTPLLQRIQFVPYIS
jgi:hypothetical protein